MATTLVKESINWFQSHEEGRATFNTYILGGGGNGINDTCKYIDKRAQEALLRVPY